MNKRPAPAFQWYASDFLADEAFMLASLEERGLFATLMSHCWVNGDITANPERMAKLLGLDSDVTKAAANGSLVCKHFTNRGGDQNRLYSPELDRQRARLVELKQKQTDGGRVGGKRTQAQRQVSSSPSSSPKAPEMKRDEMNRKEVSQEGLSSDAEREEWIAKAFD